MFIVRNDFPLLGLKDVIGSQDTERLVDDIAASLLYHYGLQIGYLLREQAGLFLIELRYFSDERHAQTLQILAAANLVVHRFAKENDYKRD